MGPLILFLLATATEPPTPIPPLVGPGEQGYWFYRDHPQKSAPEPVPMPKPSTRRPDCETEEGWREDCGFVVPKSFEMQSRERDALLKGMVMHPENPDAVRAVQEYTRWMLHQALYAASVWQYNRLSEPRKFDPMSLSPVSALGLRLAMDVDKDTRRAVWNAIRDAGGFLVVFTRRDCDYCAGQVGPLSEVARTTGLDVWDAPLDATCYEQYAARCVSPPLAEEGAKVLSIDVVPTVVLHLPPGTWIKASAGLTDALSIEDRIYNLFIGWKLAASGVVKATGDTGIALDPDVQPKDKEELLRLLKMPVAPSTP
jgi:hypothetical protein